MTSPTQATPKKRKRGPIFLVIMGVIAVLVVIAGVKTMQIRKLMAMGAKMTPPPTTVASATAEQGNWQPMLTAVGSISPVQGAVVSSELGGVVGEVRFQNGAMAKKGDVLVRLAATTEDADLQLAQADLERARDLAARKVISKAEMDAAESKLKQKQGAVEKKEVRAPFDGQLGIRLVNVGQMIPAGQQVVSLQALDQVFVDFSLPQQQLSDVRAGLDVNVKTDAIPGREFSGKLTAVNSAIDPATRNVSLQATLENRDHALRAGMFARVQVLLPQTKPTLFIPATAVSYAPYGNSVYVIEKKHDDKANKDSLVLRQQFIRTGETRGDFVAVTEGLKPGEQVVSAGVFKLRNGMDVVVDNKLAPKPNEAPTPADS